jgi:peptidyl-tRNA hydrolase
MLSKLIKEAEEAFDMVCLSGCGCESCMEEDSEIIKRFLAKQITKAVKETLTEVKDEINDRNIVTQYIDATTSKLVVSLADINKIFEQKFLIK